MRTGYGWETFRDLCAARGRVSGDRQLGHPFVSVFGPNYKLAPRKLLYVGKSPWATEHEGEATGSLDEYEASALWSAYWLGRQASPSTPFWSFAADVAKAIMPDIEEPPTSYLAWSNLAKVAQIDHGAPDQVVSAAMHDAECAALEVELGVFNPDLVVLVSNESVWNVATTLFGDRQDMTVHSDGTWTRSHPRGFKLYWTRHPQGATIEWRAEHAARIASLINS